MKLVIDARESGTSTGRYVDKLIEYLHKLEPKFDVVILAKSPRLEFMQQIAPQFKTLPADIKEFTFAEQLALAWRLYRLKPDLVHFSMTHQPLLYFGKSITTVHDLTTAYFYNPDKTWLMFKFKQAVYRELIHWVAVKSKRLITPSQYVKYDLAHFAQIEPAKISVTYEAADTITVEPEPVAKLKGRRFLLFIGRPTPHKNLERLTQAVAGLQTKYPDLHLVLAGKTDANYRRLQQFVQQQSIKQVVFTDFVSEGELRWLYEQAAAYVFPSLSEGFGLPGLEAMAHDLPVVASRATCLPEVYKAAAIYFDPLKVDDMTAKIESVLSDPELAKNLVSKGQKLVKTYSWRQTAEQTLEIYQKYLTS